MYGVRILSSNLCSLKTAPQVEEAEDENKSRINARIRRMAVRSKTRRHKLKLRRKA